MFKKLKTRYDFLETITQYYNNAESGVDSGCCRVVSAPSGGGIDTSSIRLRTQRSRMNQRTRGGLRASYRHPPRDVPITRLTIKYTEDRGNNITNGETRVSRGADRQ